MSHSEGMSGSRATTTRKTNRADRALTAAKTGGKGISLTHFGRGFVRIRIFRDLLHGVAYALPVPVKDGKFRPGDFGKCRARFLAPQASSFPRRFFLSSHARYFGKKSFSRPAEPKKAKGFRIRGANTRPRIARAESYFSVRMPWMEVDIGFELILQQALERTKAGTRRKKIHQQPASDDVSFPDGGQNAAMQASKYLRTHQRISARDF